MEDSPVLELLPEEFPAEVTNEQPSQPDAKPEPGSLTPSSPAPNAHSNRAALIPTIEKQPTLEPVSPTDSNSGDKVQTQTVEAAVISAPVAVVLENEEPRTEIQHTFVIVNSASSSLPPNASPVPTSEVKTTLPIATETDKEEKHSHRHKKKRREKTEDEISGDVAEPEALERKPSHRHRHHEENSPDNNDLERKSSRRHRRHESSQNPEEKEDLERKSSRRNREKEGDLERSSSHRHKKTETNEDSGNRSFQRMPSSPTQNRTLYNTSSPHDYYYSSGSGFNTARGGLATARSAVEQFALDLDEIEEEHKKKNRNNMLKCELITICTCICVFCCCLILGLLILSVVGLGLAEFWSLVPPPWWRPGTRSLDPATKFALKSQVQLSMNLPIDQVPRIGSHNSFNSRMYGSAYSFGPSQYYTIGDQLDMGVRFLDFSIHYIPDFTDNPLVLCEVIEDSGLETFCTYTRFLCDIVGLSDYGPQDRGCRTGSITVESAFQEIVTWHDERNDLNEIVIVKIKDFVDADENKANNVTASLNQLISTIFGTSVLTPAEAVASYGVGNWPTLAQMQATGKWIVLFNETRKRLDEPLAAFLHDNPTPIPAYTTFVKAFRPYPDCGYVDAHQNGALTQVPPMFTHFWESQMVIRTMLTGTMYNGTADKGGIDSLTAAELNRCGFSMLLDNVAGSRVADTIWTFDMAPGFDGDSGSSLCVALNMTSTRWQALDCSAYSYSFACRSDSNPEIWTVSAQSGSWDQNANKCPSGYSFATPATPRQNHAIFDAAATANGVWLRMNKPQGLAWVI